ncbi:MAG TPA: 7-cyano-7-deazaguanine synthase, partial [Sulfurovum sp.]|nr:7-cyano-7-deazaguanine synthase [Sulfurovum sp.]
KEESKACGVCDSCRLRLKGFEEAGEVDPILYI